MSRLPRCKYCKARVIFAQGADGRKLPIDLGTPAANVLLTPTGEGWRYSFPMDIEKLRERGYVTGSRHRCEVKK
jgi:hypothetical protein